MTTKFKEKIIALGRSKRAKKFYYSYFIIEMILIVASKKIFTSMQLLYRVAYIGAIIGLFILVLWRAMDAITKYEDEIIYKNSLIYLILSDDNAVGRYLIWGICFIILPIILHCITLNFTTGAIIVVGTFAITIKLSNIISKYFKNKLSK